MISRFFALGGVPFQLCGTTERTALPPVYDQFVAGSSAQPAAIYKILDPDETVPPALPAALAWSCETWRIGRNATGRWTIEIALWPDETWLPVADAAEDFSEARIVPRVGRTGSPSPYALNYPIDQALIVNRLLHHQACILHGSGVLHNGRALLFIGRSGIGKTTLARLWRGRGATLLNDDRMILRREGDQILLSASPWHGEERAVHNATAPLAAIFHLSQAPVNRLIPLTGALAAARLVANAVAPFYSGAGLQRLAALAECAIEQVPCWSLAFAPTEAVVDDCLRVIDATPD